MTCSRSPLQILAADIGGTHARFSTARVDDAFQVELGSVFRMETRQPGVSGFADFWSRFREQAPAELADPGSHDAVALALAGSVSGRSAVLPNIDWNIAPADFDSFDELYLLNDFIAQGYALACSGALENLQTVRAGVEAELGVIALVGAGTGLGHCALHPEPRPLTGCLAYRVAGSEAGHASFSFQGERENRIEQEWKQRTGKHWLSNDDVVSGPGIETLHACLTGEAVSAAEALERSPETAELFTRFYARACRNFCLNVFPVRCLVLSGGVAARNPQLVRSETFSSSFNDGRYYSGLLAAVPILLNTDENLGLRGAAVYAAQTLLAATPQ